MITAMINEIIDRVFAEARARNLAENGIRVEALTPSQLEEFLVRKLVVK